MLRRVKIANTPGHAAIGSCREFYAKAGLRQQDSGWTGTIADFAPSPSWLAIDAPAAARS